MTHCVCITRLVTGSDGTETWAPIARGFALSLSTKLESTRILTARSRHGQVSPQYCATDVGMDKPTARLSIPDGTEDCIELFSRSKLSPVLVTHGFSILRGNTEI